MKKLSLLIACLLPLLAETLLAQTSHADVLSALKDPRTPATSVDALLPHLLAMEKQVILNADSQQQVLDIYLNASYAYARNFHFKQGLLVYQGFLGLKDKYAALDKNASVQTLLQQNKDKRAGLDEEIVRKKNEAEQLVRDTDYWEKMNGKFSRNYSLIVILATAVLALVFIRINMNVVKAKNKLDDNRARMLEMQRLAVMGRFYSGALMLLKSSTRELMKKSADLTELARNKYAGTGDLSARTEELMKKVSQVQGKTESLLNP